MDPLQLRHHALVDGAIHPPNESVSALPIDNLFTNKVKLKRPDINQRKLVTLLPKPAKVPEIKSRPKLQVHPRSPVPGPCGISQCDRPSCRLLSHRQYMNAKAKLQDKENSRTDSRRNPTQHRKQSSASSSLDKLHPTIAKAAGFPLLPLDKSEQSNPILRQLFHDFFVKLVNRLHTMLIPPFSGYPKWLQTRHQELFQNGTNRQIDCLNFLGAAHAYFTTRSGKGLPRSDSVGIMIHNDLMKQLRDTLEEYDAMKDAERVLSIIYTLVTEDLCTSGSQNSQSSLLAHRTAMERVVDSRGGLHNMGYATTLTISLDRTIAMHVGQNPRYSTWLSATLPIQRAPLHPLVYGGFFLVRQDNRRIHHDIVSFCNEVCRAIEILEGERWQFDGKVRESTPEIFYLYYLRDRVATKFVFLNARFVSDNTIDRCVLLATKIVEYIVLVDDYMASTTLLVAHRLQNLIKEQNVRQIWKGWEDVFLWVAFILACMPDYWTEREWATSVCFYTLQYTYGKHWPIGWQQKQSDNLMRFVWSTTRLDDAFQNACANLQVMALKSLEDGERKPNTMNQVSADAL